MKTKAQLNGIRLPPRKVRLVARLVKKLDVSKALDQLEHTIRRPAPILKRLILSAVSNAVNNFHMVRDNLYVSDIIVDEGVKLKRFMPRAQGRATEIQKKTSRITVVLDERVAGLKGQVQQPKAAHEKNSETVEAEEKKTQSVRMPAIKRELGKKTGLLNDMKKKLFQRKSV